MCQLDRHHIVNQVQWLIYLFISYRPSFFPIDLLPKHINHKSTGEKTRIHNLPYRPCNAQEDEISNYFSCFITTVCLTGSGMIFKFMMQYVKSKINQFENRY